jgi:hypothetical protein
VCVCVCVCVRACVRACAFVSDGHSAQRDPDRPLLETFVGGVSE